MPTSAFVLDSSPAILLGRIHRLDLLGRLAPEVLVPRAVFDELRAAEDRDRTADILAACAWVRSVPDGVVPPEIAAWDLGRGENHVLVHALGRADRACVLDDRAARRCAESLGIPVPGTLGLVLLARRRGILAAARPIFEELRRSGLYVTDDLVEAALALVGE